MRKKRDVPPAPETVAEETWNQAWDLMNRLREELNPLLGGGLQVRAGGDQSRPDTVTEEICLWQTRGMGAGFPGRVAAWCIFQEGGFRVLVDTECHWDAVAAIEAIFPAARSYSRLEFICCRTKK